MSDVMLEKNKELPTSWVKTKLENCVHILDDRRIPINSSQREERKGNVPYYGATGQVGWIDDCLFDEEIVLLGEDGAPFFENFKNKAYFVTGKSWVNNHAHVLKGISDLLLNKFLCHYLNQIDYHGYVNGTTRLKLNQSAMKQIPVILAPINEQRRIVYKIEELFSEIDNSQKSLEFLLKKIEEYKKIILDFAFRGILTESWRRSKKITAPNEFEIENWKKMRETQYQLGCKISRNNKKPKLSSFEVYKLSNFPDSWLGMTIDSACGHIIDCPHSTPKFMDSGNYCVDTTCIENSKIRVEDLRFVSDKEFKNRTIRMPLLANDVLFSREGTIGVSVLVPPGLELCLGQRIMMLRFSPFILPKYAELFLQTFEFQKQYKPLIKSTTSPHLNIEDIRKFFIVVPSLSEQEIIVKILDEKISLINSMKSTIQECFSQLKLLKKSILNLAFEGKLIPQDPTDESASVLLERIKQGKEKLLETQKVIKAKTVKSRRLKNAK